jgi:hypothetical protein
MPSTKELIDTLSGQLLPVRRLRPPLWRALGWIVLATTVITALALIRGLRTDIQTELGAPAYYVQVVGAWLSGAAATLAAFNVSLPDRSRLWLLLPAPFMFLWLTGFAYGCLGDWIAIPTGAPVIADSVRCLETIVMASLPLSLVLWVTLRRNKPLRPAGTAWIGGVAVAGFADTAHLLIHTVQASLLVLLINLVPVALIVLLSGLVGQRHLESATVG